MTSLELFAAYWKDNEFTGYYDFPGDYEQVAEDAWQVSRRTALEDALRAVQRAGLDYPCVEREPAEAAYDAIRALMEGE